MPFIPKKKIVKTDAEKRKIMNVQIKMILRKKSLSTENIQNCTPKLKIRGFKVANQKVVKDEIPSP